MTVFFDEERQRWRYDFQLEKARYARECLDASGNPVASKRAAQECENEARRLARISPKLIRASDLTFAQVMNDLSEIWQKEPGWDDRRRKVSELVAFFGAETAMRDIDGARIQDYIAFALRQPLRVWKGGPAHRDGKERWAPHPSGKTRAPATVNRYLPLLRAAFKRAYNTRDPLTRERAVDELPAIAELQEMKHKARPVPDDVLSDVIETLPAHVVEALRATLFFGFRRNEIFRLKIHNVDFDARGIRLDAQDVKNKTDAFIPGSSHAMQFMAQLVDQARDRRSTYLITWTPYRDEKKRAAAKWHPIKSPKTAWRTAMAAIEKTHGRRWRWHDIRAAYITQVAIMSGAMAAQKLARHHDFATTQGYVEVADDVMRAAAETASDRPALRGILGGKA